MVLYKSSNPALNADTFKKVQRVKGSTEAITIQGTVNKIGLLIKHLK